MSSPNASEFASPADDGLVPPPAPHPQGARPALILGSLGVVFGDIGTSPLYAFREAAAASGEGAAGAADPAIVLGVLSLIFWALVLVVSVKYVLLLLAADNNGEGGTLSLMALAQRGLARPSFGVLLLGMAGASLFFGDAAITPAISVLSAVEGLEVAAPRLEPFVLPLTLLILVALFAVQRSGTGRVSSFFGPVTAFWFLVLGASGAVHLAAAPEVLAALSPHHGARLLIDHGFLGIVVLGSVFLAITGAEALYADLGHFGRAPIRAAWFGLVFPALALNYFGQGALVLDRPDAIRNPFFLLFPEWLVLPVVILATAATVIASQAVISGAYSLARQAIQLGLLPRMRILFTSETQTGQIYIPRINWLLFATVVLLTLLFGSSANLAAAYGISVSASMAVDGVLAFVVLRYCWGWSLAASAAIIAPVALIDFTFLGANTLKIAAGGWAPILLGGTILVTMLTWRRGAMLLFEKTRRQEVPLADLVRQIEAKPPARVPGTAVFLTGDPEGAPTALLHNLKHNKVLHERNIVLTIRTEPTPRVTQEERVEIEEISRNFQRVILKFGFMETPNLSKGMAACRRKGLAFDIMSTSFFLSRRNLKMAAKPGMPRWQDRLFLALADSADAASDYFQIPADRVVEIGAQVAV